VHRNAKQRSTKTHPSKNCCKTTPSTTDPLEPNLDHDQDDIPLRDRLKTSKTAQTPNSGSNAANARERPRKRKEPQPRWSREQSTPEEEDTAMHTPSHSQATATIITTTRRPQKRQTKRKIAETSSVTSLESTIETGD
jgi:hypothetical protein